MKTAAEYPVSFPYGATTAPYSAAHPHQGQDRAMPTGTPVVVNGVTIGLSGTTGKSTGPHLHVQKVQKNQVVNPNGGGFDLPTPIAVYDVGNRSDIGNYVRIKDASGAGWSYFHLSQINVGKGILGGMDDVNKLKEIASARLDQLRRLMAAGGVDPNKNEANDASIAQVIANIDAKNKEIESLKKQGGGDYAPVGQLYVKKG